MNTQTSKPFSIRIFMPDGQADGLKIVEKSNWSGRGVVCPSALLSFTIKSVLEVRIFQT
jgi:hypothetical protein